jgi:hypothetical protein
VSKSLHIHTLDTSYGVGCISTVTLQQHDLTCYLLSRRHVGRVLQQSSPPLCWQGSDAREMVMMSLVHDHSRGSQSGPAKRPRLALQGQGPQPSIQPVFTGEPDAILK